MTPSRRSSRPSEVPLAQRARLLGELRSLLPATLQKLWLPSPALAVLQLRVPGRTALAILDARLVLAALVEERPTSTEATPRSQATLRAALEGAQLLFARFETAADGVGKPAVRLAFATEAGTRALVAEPDAGALLLLAPAASDATAEPASGAAAPVAEPASGAAARVAEPASGAAAPGAEPVARARERIVWAGSGGTASRRPGSEYRDVVELAASGDESDAGQAPDREILRGAVAAEEAAGVLARKKELEKRLRAKAQKLRRTLAAVDEDAARASSAASDRRSAELLVPVAASVPKGAREVDVPDWTQLDASGAPQMVKLRLDPALSARDNAARWFKRAQRYASALPRIAARRAEISATLEGVLGVLERAAPVADAAGLRALESEVGAPAAPRAPRGRERPRLPYRAYLSRSGARILVGRSARDNDELLRGARGNDLWLHARAVHGSHVVVPDPGEAPDARTLLDAALLAAHFSGARGSDGAEVAWTRRKHVRKPKGAAPGAVTITQDRTIFVRKDEATLRTLLASAESETG